MAEEANDLIKKKEIEESKLNVAVSDRVKRSDYPGCHGVIKELHQEVTGSSGQTARRAWLCKVQWDNGTFSYYNPFHLEKI